MWKTKREGGGNKALLTRPKKIRGGGSRRACSGREGREERALSSCDDLETKGDSSLPGCLTPFRFKKWKEPCIGCPWFREERDKIRGGGGLQRKERRRDD